MICPKCEGYGWATEEDGYQVVCPTCLGVGAIFAPPTVPVLAKFAGSLVGMGGGTVVRGIEPSEQPTERVSRPIKGKYLT